MPISGKTALYGLIAHPVAHVRSPTLFNPFLAERGIDGVLVPLHITPEDLPRAVDGLRRFENLRGFLVTIPHKETIVPLLDALTPAAEQVGAVNIVRRDPGGRLTGGQIDGDGFVAALRRAGGEPSGKRCFMAGAGGVAAGIGFALARAGAATLTVHNRTPERAEKLAARIGKVFPNCEVRLGSDPAGHDIVVNATSAGLHPADPLPLDLSRLESGMFAADVVIEPRQTPFLLAAAGHGCRVQYGAAMVVEQLPLMIEFMGAPA